MRDFLFDVLADPVAQRQRRNRHPFEPRGLRVAGHIVENVRDVARDDRIGGKEREIGVDAGRNRMIVARPDVDIRGKRSAFRRTTIDSLAWVLSSMKPYTTCAPARSSARDQRIFASSSKRALSSIRAVTDLPASAASTSARTMGDSADVRYSVCLMATTSGSRAACCRNWTTTSNDS